MYLYSTSITIHYHAYKFYSYTTLPPPPPPQILPLPLLPLLTYSTNIPRGSSQSIISDGEESSLGFDDLDDIPLQEIDEMDCLKNASVKILLSFIEFLEEGMWVLLCYV